VTRTAGSNAVVSGLFFDSVSGTASTSAPMPTSTPAPYAGASASFVAQDVTTHGNWKGVYGAQGYWLDADGQSVPG